MVSNLGTSNTVFDKEGLLNRLMGDTELVGVVLESFLSDTPERMELLKDAMDNGMDMENIVLQAHVIKGAAGNVGAVAISDIAEALESDGRLEEEENIGENFNKLEKAFEEFKEAVKGVV